MKSLILLLLFCSSSKLCKSQATEGRMAEIDRFYEEVESKLKNCKVITTSEWSNPDTYEGVSSELTGYFDTSVNKIIKIIDYSAGDWYESSTSYYYRNSELFFVFIRSNSAETMYTAKELDISEEQLFEIGGEAKTMLYEELRFYFEKEVAFRFLRKEKIIVAESEEVNLRDVKNIEMDFEPEAFEQLIYESRLMIKFLKTKF